MSLRIGSLCTGYGGLDAAVQRVLGGRLAWVADPNPGAAAILKHHHPNVPNLGDIKLANWQRVIDEHGPVDVVTAGYPCQPFSAAGLGLGVADERHLWPWIVPAIRVLRPRIVVLENVREHLGRGFDAVLGDLASLGFDAEWQVVRASDVGDCHGRPRIFVVAFAADAADLRHEWGWQARGRGHGSADRRRIAADTDRDALVAMLNGGTPEPEADHDHDQQHAPGRVLDWGAYTDAVHRWETILGRPAPWPTEPGANGQPRLTPTFVEWMQGLPAGYVTNVPGISRDAQLKALGNGVVPQQAIAALQILLERRAAA